MAAPATPPPPTGSCTPVTARPVDSATRSSSLLRRPHHALRNPPAASRLLALPPRHPARRFRSAPRPPLRPTRSGIRAVSLADRVARETQAARPPDTARGLPSGTPARGLVR